MSETTKGTESIRAGSDRPRNSNQAASARNGEDRSTETEGLMSETVSEAVVTATKISSKVAEEAQQALMTGVRTVSEVGGRVADISFGRGRDILASAKRTMDVYRDASERSTDGIQALFSSWMAIGRSLQHMQHAWLEALDHSMQHATHKPQDLLRCKTPIEFAEVQRDLYIDAVNHAIRASSRMLDVINHTAQDAARPLQNSRH